MSDENVGGLEASISAIETPEIGLHKLLVQRGADLSDLDRARVKRAIDALSAHGQPVVDEAMVARAEAYTTRVLPGRSTACLGGQFNFCDLLTAAITGDTP